MDNQQDPGSQNPPFPMTNQGGNSQQHVNPFANTGTQQGAGQQQSPVQPPAPTPAAPTFSAPQAPVTPPQPAAVPPTPAPTQPAPAPMPTAPTFAAPQAPVAPPQPAAVPPTPMPTQPAPAPMPTAPTFAAPQAPVAPPQPAAVPPTPMPAQPAPAPMSAAPTFAAPQAPTPAMPAQSTSSAGTTNPPAQQGDNKKSEDKKEDNTPANFQLGTKLPAQLKVPIPPHTLKMDEKYFMRLLASSISLSKEEKKRIIRSLPKLKQPQVDELIRIFEDEKKKFAALSKKHLPQLEKLAESHYLDWLSIEDEYTYKDRKVEEDSAADEIRKKLGL